LPAPDPRPPFLAARARLACGDVVGEAVFVTPERALGSIACPAGEGQLRLSDGRELLARALPGAPAGTSVLAVPGGAAPFVAPGAATGLPDGAPLLVALEGGGPGVVGEATARGLANVAGMALLVAEDAGGPLAGPVADATGSLVAIAPSDPPDPERPYLAVPMEAFAGVLGGPTTPAWSAARERAVDEDRAAQAGLWNRLRRATALLAARPAGDGLALVVVRASMGRPPSEAVRLVLEPVARDCTVEGRVVDWRTGPRLFAGAGLPPDVAARLGRMEAPPGGGALWMGTGSARVDCDLARVADGTTLSIAGADPVAPVPFPKAGLAEVDARRSRDAASAAQVEAVSEASDAVQAAEEAAAFEAGWRQAFREANARVAVAAQRRTAIEAERDEARSNFQYVLEEQLAGDLEVAKLEQRRAEEALHELDRRASLAAVPRAWRR
jgi:hypothetical protein